MPSLANFSSTCGLASTRFRSALSLSTIALGVFAGRKKSDPLGEFASAHALLRQRGHIGRLGVALQAGNAKRFHLACLDIGGGRVQRIHHHLDVAGDQVLRRGSGAFVRNIREQGAGLRGEQFRAQMIGAADTRGAVGNLVRIRFRVGDEFAQIAESEPRDQLTQPHCPW